MADGKWRCGKGWEMAEGPREDKKLQKVSQLWMRRRREAAVGFESCPVGHPGAVDHG